MDLLLSAWMVYLSNFTPEYSLILLIILKSAYEMFTMLQSTNSIILQDSSGRYLRQGPLSFCLCPQCFVLKSDIYKLGQATDFTSQVKKAHTYVGNTIHGVRDFIYKHGYGISSIVVECILKPESWTPTLVRSCSNFEVCATS